MPDIFSQLTLKIRVRDDASFDNFYPGKNVEVLAYLKKFIEKDHESFAYLWGHSFSGRTHLLQASCHAVSAQALATFYLPLVEKDALSPQVLENLESLSLICIDDIDQIAGNAEWEESLFHLYNKIMVSKTRLLVSASLPPTQLPFHLRDLQSRLTSGTVFQLHALSDDEKILALQKHAMVRGIELPTQVGEFLLQRCSREMSTLCATLEKLDEASFASKRKLTIPFVKEVVGI